MPIPLLRPHLVMLPRLDAEEALHDAERLAVGTGSMKPAPRSEVVARWQKAAASPASLRPRDPGAHAALAAAAGIGVRVVRRG